MIQKAKLKLLLLGQFLAAAAFVVLWMKGFAAASSAERQKNQFPISKKPLVEVDKITSNEPVEKQFQGALCRPRIL